MLTNKDGPGLESIAMIRIYLCEFVAEDIFVYDKNNNF
jgi:hypothetical protein